MTGIAPIRLMVGKTAKNHPANEYLPKILYWNECYIEQILRCTNHPTYKRHLLQAIKYIIGKAFMLIFPVKQTILYLKCIHRNRPLPAIQQAQHIAASYQFYDNQPHIYPANSKQ